MGEHMVKGREFPVDAYRLRTELGGADG